MRTKTLGSPLSYTHAVPLAPLEEMEIDLWPDEYNQSIGMLWLRPRVNYPVYLRDGAYDRYPHRQMLRRADIEMVSDGTDNDHLVAVEILTPESKRDYWRFHRSTWWVKSYDAFHGYRPASSNPLNWYSSNNPSTGGYKPSEAIEICAGSLGFDRTTLRPWDGKRPINRKLDWSRVPEWTALLPPSYPRWETVSIGLFHLLVLHGKRAMRDYTVHQHYSGAWVAVRRRNPYLRLGECATAHAAKQLCEDHLRQTTSV